MSENNIQGRAASSEFRTLLSPPDRGEVTEAMQCNMYARRESGTQPTPQGRYSRMPLLARHSSRLTVGPAQIVKHYRTPT